MFRLNGNAGRVQIANTGNGRLQARPASGPRQARVSGLFPLGAPKTTKLLEFRREPAICRLRGGSGGASEEKEQASKERKQASKEIKHFR